MKLLREIMTIMTSDMNNGNMIGTIEYKKKTGDMNGKCGGVIMNAKGNGVNGKREKERTTKKK